MYRLVKEGGKGTTKIIKINKNEFTDFVNIAKATFGAFKVQLDDDARSKRYISNLCRILDLFTSDIICP